MLSAASLLAITLLASSLLFSSTDLGAQDAVDSVPVVTNITHVTDTTQIAEDAVSPSVIAPTNDAGLRSHQDLYGDRWGVVRIGAPEIWHATDFSATVVAVLDTGIAADAQFSDRLIGAIDLTLSGTTDDEHGHGTHMADTIAAVAPNARILNVKVADHRGRCDSATVAQGIRWAADRGAQVINISLEVAHSSQLEDAVSYAWARGAVIVAAAGNNGTTDPAYPAAYENAIAVAGTNRDDGMAVLSNHGGWIDIAAPGQKIVARSHEGDLTYETGTSPAAAHVSGVAALLLGMSCDDSADGFSNDTVRRALLSSADALTITGTGSGRVSAPAAISVLEAGRP